MDSRTETELKALLASISEIELAVLIGSRASGEARPESDWDFAIQWARNLNPIDRLGKSECLRRALARLLAVNESRVDLVELPRAGLAMRSAVADHGRVLKGEDSLAWLRFLSRTWKDLEDYQWEQDHAA